MRRGCVTTIFGFIVAHCGRALRTRVWTSTSSSSSPPSKYFAFTVLWPSDTSSIWQRYHTSSNSTSTMLPTSSSGDPAPSSESGSSTSQSLKSSRMNCGSWVDLPLPVPPLTMMDWLYSRALASSSRTRSAGSLPLTSSRRQSSSSGLVTSHLRLAVSLGPSLSSPVLERRLSSSIAAMRRPWRAVASSSASPSCRLSPSLPSSSRRVSSWPASPRASSASSSFSSRRVRSWAHSAGACGAYLGMRRALRTCCTKDSPAASTAASRVGWAPLESPHRFWPRNLPFREAFHDLPQGCIRVMLHPSMCGPRCSTTCAAGKPASSSCATRVSSLPGSGHCTHPSAWAIAR
mmetsp:Transcript_34652/g.99202  ORF Transcript_34652/g.99202 Transcript_34652/m.99202 type:complete len:347 (-) Transcript_34652:448-1488(-)